ncbi:MAG TPA: hypothetical protein VGE74_29290 [Gemmata sp.]
MRALFVPLLLLAICVAFGCKRGAELPPDTTTAGTSNFARLGPLGLSVESVRLGKVRMRGMLGQDGESKEDIFTIKTRFKLFDTSMPVKQAALQRDGGLITFGDGGLKLTDERGVRMKVVTGGGFDGVRARRTDTVVLTADHNETTDLLTFESVAGATGDLTLEVPANYQVMQSDGTFMQPKEAGTFKIKIPKAIWAAAPHIADAGPGHWYTVGPVSMSVDAVRLGKVKVRTFGIGGGTGDSKEDALAVTVKVRLANTTVRVKKPPFLTGGPVAAFSGVSVTLRPAKGGDPFKTLTAFGLSEIVGHQQKDIELSEKRPELTDLLTFEAGAAQADELILTLWPKWQEQKADGTWTDATAEDDFRFRIPKSLWAR